ncbi:MAG: Asp-tRNA(Asn)/Glu-tRNA(Gln) amidotransferase subunit GatB [Gammaproteobacteria bacterium]|nr:Asp-tRNA(Asn)/Glu-tRNA(Gln) amidotransferase subunit GatB [Gammaproteobacteria bacterium]
MMQWQAVIGLEIHAQLSSKSKIFSGSSTAFGAPPNTQANAVDLGLPGVLPVVNGEVIRMAVRFGLATGAKIGRRSVFARKNYFYPDLPKGYQISQMELPIVGPGVVDIRLEDGSTKSVRLTRAHLEEDAGKSLHEDYHGMTGVDLNRAGTPLLEIVSEPDMSSAKEAVAYARKIHSLVRYIDICDGNMQEGSFRCDANVSVRLPGEALGTRAEIKNVNSFRFLERAINFEIERQIDILEAGGEVVQETRLYDADLDETRSMRSKEEANDYRYFPDPDLLPVELSEAFIESVRADLPELPDARRQRFVDQYGLPEDDAATLTQDREQAEYFEAAVSENASLSKLACNWISGELSGRLNKDGLALSQSRIGASQLGGLLARIADNTISGKIAKQVFEAMWNGEGDADEIIEKQGLVQITDTSAIEAMIDEVIAANPAQVDQYRGGKDKLLGFFVGQVMKASGGKANPAQLNEILRKKLQDGG